MTDIEKQEKVEIDIPEIANWQMAFQMVISGLGFLFINYKKTTIAILVFLTFLIYQAVMNFQQIKTLLSSLGLG